ncbi:MAG: TPM domain-containing protein [Acidobacteria bacterium]|jgi:putative membrane protein|nr:TPM domain-containing protein [Acidobacteriota bacterium]
MKTFLSDQERTKLDQRVADAEKRTGAQIVLAVIGRSDSFAELPWKAFALGAAIVGPVAVLVSMLRPVWTQSVAALLIVVATLGAGALCALVCVACPPFARLFLDSHRAEVEVRQYARSLFLERELFATHGRRGVLLLVSMFERHVVLLPDKGLEDRLGEAASQEIVRRMTATLAAGQVCRALEEGLAGVEDALGTAAPGAPQENELPDTIVEEEGS